MLAAGLYSSRSETFKCTGQHMGDSVPYMLKSLNLQHTKTCATFGLINLKLRSHDAIFYLICNQLA